MGPGSVLYESYGDRLGFLCAGTTGLLQLMYPALGRGVEEHSAFYDEPLDRLLRSVPQIVSIVFDGDLRPEQARTVRDFHRDIKGSMPASQGGERYHALDPETFFWATPPSSTWPFASTTSTAAAAWTTRAGRRTTSRRWSGGAPTG